MNTHNVENKAFRSACALQLAYLFCCICFAFVFLQRAVAAAWQQPTRVRREDSGQMQNPSLLLLGIN